MAGYCSTVIDFSVIHNHSNLLGHDKYIFVEFEV